MPKWCLQWSFLNLVLRRAEPRTLTSCCRYCMLLQILEFLKALVKRDALHILGCCQYCGRLKPALVEVDHGSANLEYRNLDFRDHENFEDRLERSAEARARLGRD